MISACPPTLGNQAFSRIFPSTPLYSGTALVSGSPSPSTSGRGGPVSPCWQHPLLGWVRDRGASGSGSQACLPEGSPVRKRGLPQGPYPPRRPPPTRFPGTGSLQGKGMWGCRPASAVPACVRAAAHVNGLYPVFGSTVTVFSCEVAWGMLPSGLTRCRAGSPRETDSGLERVTPLLSDLDPPPVSCPPLPQGTANNL